MRRTSIGGTENAGYVGGTKHANMVQDWACQPASGPCADNSDACPEPQLREVIKCPTDDCGAEQVRHCSLDPCALDPCALNPCALDPCTLDPCAPNPDPRSWLSDMFHSCGCSMCFALVDTLVVGA